MIIWKDRLDKFVPRIKRFLIFGDGSSKTLHPKDLSGYYGVTDS
tara:strand:- start:691 stop:822 length:132 start_codon:yes stop_codon:yes gene_type:complete